MNAIEIRNLTKNFGEKQALTGLNMTVPMGSIYGFIGENGSGKSTTEKLICGHLVKDSGSIKLFGKDYTDAGVRVKVGALIENAGCFPGASIYTNLKMQALNLGIENPDEEIDRVLKIVRMQENKQLKFKKCSLGMKQRIGIAMALLGSPALLILDEPINGLDANSVMIFKEILSQLAAQGKTIFYSSHLMDVVEKISSRIILLYDGKIAADGTFAELQADNAAGTLEGIFNELTGFDNYKEIGEQFVSVVQEVL